MKQRKNLILVTALLLLPGISAAKSCETGLETCIKIFKEGFPPQKNVMVQQLEWMGYSDPKLFDLIEKSVLDRYEVASSGNEIDHLSWMVKGLGYSGNDEYRATLNAIINSKKAHRKIRKFAKQALKSIDKHNEWNPVISNKSGLKKGKSALANRYVNMLSSDNLELNRLAAKRIYRTGYYSPYVLNAVGDALQRTANAEKLDGLGADSIAWLMKVLASTIDDKYVGIVQEVADSSGNKKIKKLGAKYIKEYKW